jgi:hypothetical protein
MQSFLFQTGSIALPASRELHSVVICEHLHQNLFWACISRILRAGLIGELAANLSKRGVVN